MRRNPDSKLQKAARRFKAESSDENYRKFAKQALRAGQPLVRFGVVRGGAAAGPRDPDGSCVWVSITVSGRALDAGAGIDADEQVMATLGQLPASLEVVARMQADAMNEFEPALLERWTERPEVNSRLRLTGADRQRRIQSHAQSVSVFTDIFEDAGFTIWHTGGGCTGWGLSTPEGSYALITGGNATVPETDDDVIWLGLYGSPDDDSYEDVEFPLTEEGARAAVAHAREALEF
jgi:hypothetical protein